MGTSVLLIALAAISFFSVVYTEEKRVESLHGKVSRLERVEKDLRADVRDANVKAEGLRDEITKVEGLLDRERGFKKALEANLAAEGKRCTALAEENKRWAGAAEREALVRSELDSSRRRVSELERDLSAAVASVKRIEHELGSALEEERRRAAAAAEAQTKKLEEALRAGEEARREAEERMGKYKGALAALDPAAYSSTYSDIQGVIQAVRSDVLALRSGQTAYSEELMARLAADLFEVERILRDAKAAESSAFAVFRDSDISKMVIERQKESALTSLEEMRADLKRRSLSDFLDRLSGLESRLVTLDRGKRDIDSGLTEALTAFEDMEETARRLESVLKSGAEGARGDAPAGLSGVMEEIEALRRSREGAMVAMGRVKTSMDGLLDSESKRITEDAAMVSARLGMVVPDVRRPLQAGADREDASVRVRRLEELGAFVRKAMAEKGVELSGQPDMLSRCEAQLKELLSGGKKQFMTYLVQKGDSLWGISSREEVYGDPYLWPVLFRNNVFITNPDVIEPGTSLFIRKDLTRQEMDEAISDARRHGLPGAAVKTR